MRRLLPMVSAVLALLVALALSPVGVRADTATSPLGLPPPTIPQGFGVNIHFTDPQPGEMTRFREAGFGFARMDFAWNRIEKTRGVYDFSPYDRLYATLAAAGTRPLFILDYGNDVYEKGPPRSPEARAAFARFAAASVKHFAGKGVVWEIWNEPNGDGFWPPRADASEYAALAVEAAKAIRAADPACTLIAPGSSGFPWRYLETVFKSGLLRYLDGVSVHPYRGGAPESAAADFARLRGLIGRYAPPDKRQMPMISSEWGYSTHEGGGVSEAEQGRYIVREWLANLASGVDLSIFYDWKEDGPDPRENEHHFGTVRPDLTPKPSFVAAQTLIAALRGYTFRHRLQGKADSDWQLLFQRGDSGDLALVTWNASGSAPAADQMPAVRKLAASDSDYQPLLRLASIRFSPGPLAATGRNGVALEVISRNPDKSTASFRLDFANADPPDHRFGLNVVRLAPDSRKAGSVTLFLAPNSSGEGRAYPEVLWGNQTLPTLAPIPMIRTDPIFVTVAPWRGTLRVFVEDPAGGPLQGKLTRSTDHDLVGVRVPVAYVDLPSGATHVEATLPLPSPGTPFQIFLFASHDPATVGATPKESFIPFADFPADVTKPTGFRRMDFVKNAPQDEKPPLIVVKTDANAPADAALDFSYRFTPGWFYTEATPDASLAATPAGATALALWIRDDGSNNALRSRLRDATGQYFQPDLGRLDKSGWRLVTIPLSHSGLSKEAHWGGANDGVPHLPLAWDSLILIDSTSPAAPHSGEVLLAAPTYVMTEKTR